MLSKLEVILHSNYFVQVFWIIVFEMLENFDFHTCLM